jgi:hypothetical protein
VSQTESPARKALDFPLIAPVAAQPGALAFDDNRRITGGRTDEIRLRPVACAQGIVPGLGRALA